MYSCLNTNSLINCYYCFCNKTQGYLPSKEGVCKHRTFRRLFCVDVFIVLLLIKSKMNCFYCRKVIMDSCDAAGEKCHGSTHYMDRTMRIPAMNSFCYLFSRLTTTHPRYIRARYRPTIKALWPFRQVISIRLNSIVLSISCYVFCYHSQNPED